MGGPVWISVMEAAARLRVAHQTVRNWIATGKLRGAKLPPLGVQVVDAASLRGARKRARDRMKARRATPFEGEPAKGLWLTSLGHRWPIDTMVFEFETSLPLAEVAAALRESGLETVSIRQVTHVAIGVGAATDRASVEAVAGKLMERGSGGWWRGWTEFWRFLRD